MTCCKVTVLLSPRSHDIYVSTTPVLKIVSIIPFKDPRSQSIEPKLVDICQFPKPGNNMKRNVSTSLVSKIGTISLTTFDRKDQSLVSTQTRPIGRAAIHSTFSYSNIAKKLLICKFFNRKDFRV